MVLSYGTAQSAVDMTKSVEINGYVDQLNHCVLCCETVSHSFSMPLYPLCVVENLEPECRLQPKVSTIKIKLI